MKKLPTSIKHLIMDRSASLPVLAEMLPNNGKEDTELVPVTEIVIKTGKECLIIDPKMKAKGGAPLEPEKRYKIRLMKAVNHAKVLRKLCLELNTEAEMINFINDYTIQVIDFAQATEKSYFEPQII